VPNQRMIRLAPIAALLLVAPVAAHAQGWKPDRAVELVVYSAPGGGADKTVRILQKIMQDNKLIDSSAVVNKVGGGGALAFTYVSQQSGGHHVGIAQSNLLTNHISGKSSISHRDVALLVNIGSEPVAIAVKGDSPIRSLKDFVERLTKDPASLSISTGSTLGATNHFGTAQLAKVAGIDPRKLKIVVFGGAAEAMTALLGGHIDAVSVAVNNVLPYAGTDKLRILGLTSRQRSTTGALATIPTLREQGYDVVLDNWTIMIGPKNMSAAQIAYWEGNFGKAAQTADWKKYLALNGWDYAFMGAEATRKYVESEYVLAKTLLTDLGLGK
jgi:putative tricarboxylic transport membrane protein